MEKGKDVFSIGHVQVLVQWDLQLGDLQNTLGVRNSGEKWIWNLEAQVVTEAMEDEVVKEEVGFREETGRQIPGHTD